MGMEPKDVCVPGEHFANSATFPLHNIKKKSVRGCLERHAILRPDKLTGRGYFTNIVLRGSQQYSELENEVTNFLGSPPNHPLCASRLSFL